MTWGTWVYLMPDSAKSMISSKDFSKFGIKGQTSPTCPGRPRAERQQEMAAVKICNSCFLCVTIANTQTKQVYKHMLQHLLCL